jgi:paraquat-inducible protein A
MAEQQSPLIACEHCGNINHLPTLVHGDLCTCPRCDSVLWRHSRLATSHWLALAIAAAILFVVANLYPVARLSVQGMTSDASLIDAVTITWQQGRVAVAIMTCLAGFLFPLFQLLLLLWVLVPLARRRLPIGFRTTMRLLAWLDPWCMVPVFLLGAVVAVVKLREMAAVSPELGLIAFGMLVMLLTILTRLSPQRIWRLAEEDGTVRSHLAAPAPGCVLVGCEACGQVQPLPADEDPETAHHCCRCGSSLHRRKPNSMGRTWALLMGATVLYIPANVLPVMTITTLFGPTDHTILGGVIELWTSGSWDIAIIVFVASIAVPMIKMLSLALLAWRVQFRHTSHLKQRTRLYEMVEVIGQWSMLDIFVVILLAALADFRGLMEVTAADGAAAFGVVVILTMLAAKSFDPRRAWDNENDVAWSTVPVHHE